MTSKPDAPRPVSTGLRALDGLLHGGLSRGRVYALWDPAGWLGSAIVGSLLDHLYQRSIRRLLVGTHPAALEHQATARSPEGGVHTSADGLLAVWDPRHCRGEGVAQAIERSSFAPEIVIIEHPMWLPTNPGDNPLASLPEIAEKRDMAILISGAGGFLANDQPGWLARESDEAERKRRILDAADVQLEIRRIPGDEKAFELNRLNGEPEDRARFRFLPNLRVAEVT